MEINNDHVIPLMVDDSHVIPMMVEDVTKPKPKRAGKTKIVTGEVKTVSGVDFPAGDTSFEMPNERKWLVAEKPESQGCGVKPEVEDVNRTVQAPPQEFPQVQHITMPVSSERRVYSIDLGDLELTGAQTQSIIEHFQNAPLSDPMQVEDLVVAEISYADIHRAAYYAERAEMQAAHLDSPAFDTSIKTPLVK